MNRWIASPEFQPHLDQWGPESTAAPPSKELARKYCRKLALGHYENFPVASLLLPRRLRQHFYNVYAYCRWADDLGDEVEGTEASLELLDWWESELDECYSGRAGHPVFVALGETIRQFDLPRQPFADLISAFRQDQSVVEYDTFEQLLDYCRRSADPVGRIVLRLWEADAEENLQWSDSICTGLQLTNFWQDVARDFEMGRVYLPREDRERFEYSTEMLEEREMNSQFAELMKFEVERTREYLEAGWPLADRVGGRYGIEVEMFIRGGLGILRKVEEQEFRVWEHRPTLRKWDVCSMLWKTLGNRLKRPTWRTTTQHGSLTPPQ
ncbi:squalene synthase HpnC [Calycomorphotria hydatis]|uniref:All-trans-phytoene synthase n=1 Tax=Calycomorphotria hydatis TaxID=2528027 RepID=A0A517TCQ1_9PLAN|nr:squalene synthase HpnC [Calycomorphotria hydatis]QDT66153.1 All-trans-phytoene synthase [Calycomorphotria hydatis]